jgi:ubiquinone/menaquinone biosynthesis C-methylase UbiE
MRLRIRALLTLFVLAFVPAAAAFAQRTNAGTIATEAIFAAIGVKEGLTICEMGAGDGEITLAAAKVAGPNGRVYTSELGEDRIKTLREKAAASGFTQVTVVSGDPLKTNFPAGGCDALFMRNVYHHFTDPAAMNQSIFASLKPGARIAVVDFAPPDKDAPTPAERGKDGMHGVTESTLTKELQEAGFQPVSSEHGDLRWFMVVLARPR